MSCTLERREISFEHIIGMELVTFSSSFGDNYLRDLLLREKMLRVTLEENRIVADVIGIVTAYDAPPETDLVIAREMSFLNARASAARGILENEFLDVYLEGKQENEKVIRVKFKIFLLQDKIRGRRPAIFSWQVARYCLEPYVLANFKHVFTEQFPNTTTVLAHIAEYQTRKQNNNLTDIVLCKDENAWCVAFMRKPRFNAHKIGFYGTMRFSEKGTVNIFPPYDPPRPELATINWNQDKASKN